MAGRRPDSANLSIQTDEGPPLPEINDGDTFSQILTKLAVSVLEAYEILPA